MKHKPHLDLIIARDQLIEEINSIVGKSSYGLCPDEMNTLSRRLRDAVRKNFPLYKLRAIQLAAFQQIATTRPE